MTAFDGFDPATRDRFFRAMVLMGGALAAGCGGISERDPTPGENADDVQSRAGTGGSASGMGGPPIGGGAGSTTAAAGAGGASGAAGMTALSCPDEQYTCTSFVCQDDLWDARGRCFCDPSLPTSAAECGPGTSFTCRPTATDPATGAELAQPTSVDCRCVPTGAWCGDTCMQAYPPVGDGYFCEGPLEGPADVLCGCSFVYLK